MSEPNTVHDYVEDMRGMVGEAKTEPEILSKVRPLSEKLFNNRDAWIKPEHYEVDKAHGYNLHVLHEKDDHTLMVFAACFKPGRVTPVHDRGTWAVVAGEEKMQSISAPTMHWSQTTARFNYAAISLSDKAT